jgi:hypothetical protein
MEKYSFTYQKYFWRFCCFAFLYLSLFFLLDFLVSIFFDNPNKLIEFLCNVIMIIFAWFYYNDSRDKKWFERKGSYWVENGLVYIQKQSKIYKLEDIKWISGRTISVWGIAKSGVLVIKTKKNKMFLISSDLSVENFNDCNLIPLYNFIIEHNSKLQKEDSLDFWYELEE